MKQRQVNDGVLSLFNPGVNEIMSCKIFLSAHVKQGNTLKSKRRETWARRLN